jgi:hypothetical protein
MKNNMIEKFKTPLTGHQWNLFAKMPLFSGFCKKLKN